MTSINQIKRELRQKGDPLRVEHSKRFFKTGKGQYGEGDVFLGLRVPEMREIAKKYKDLPLQSIKVLLNSKIHEERLIALLILVYKFAKENERRNDIYAFYIKNLKWVNNWDLVDLSAPKIVGEYLLNKNRKVLYKLAKSKNLWERRIAIVATFAFIKNNDLVDTIKIGQLLLDDKHDLIHKAVGWAWREVGKKDLKVLEHFLDKHADVMPRTALRYSIERFPEKVRKSYLNNAR